MSPYMPLLCVATAPGRATTAFASTAYPVQIRWVESDLKILETHPLTPGQRYTPSQSLTSSVVASTLPPASPPPHENGVIDSLTFGLAFLPIALALLFVFGGFIYLARSRSRRESKTEHVVVDAIPGFKPGVLRWWFLVLLLGATLSLLWLTEVACRSIPSSSQPTVSVTSGPPQSAMSVTKTHVEIQVRAEITTTKLTTATYTTE